MRGLQVLFYFQSPPVLFLHMVRQIFVQTLELVMVGDELIEPAFGLRELSFEQTDMVLPLAQQIRGSRNIQERSQLGKSLARHKRQ